MGQATLRKLLLLALVALLGGATGCTWLSEKRFEPKIAAADSAFQQQQYETAATRYEGLIESYPGAAQREHLLFQLGMAYYLAGSEHAARDAFDRYLLEYPNGQYAALARDQERKITLQTSPERVKAEALDKARNDEAALRRLLAQHPNNPEVMVALGNLLYGLGRYDAAVTQYYNALKVGAAQQERVLIKDRMMLNDEGKPVPITPGQINAAERESHPIVVFNTNDYQSRTSGGYSTGDPAFYNVTGLARNQSARILRDVTLRVTFYNQVGEMEDVAEAHLGTMAPGEIRPFRVAATHFENILNISDYRVVPQWQ